MCWFPPFLLPRPDGWELLSPESQISQKFVLSKILALLRKAHCGAQQSEHGGRDHHPAKDATTLVPPPWEGKCWSNCSMLRKEQQKWLKSRSTVPEGRSLFSSNIRHHFHSLCKTGVVASKWLLGFLLTSYIPRAAAEKDSQIQNILRKRRKKPAINHTPDVHSAFRYRWRMTSLFIWKNLGGHPPPSITLITYFNHDIKKLLLAVRGQFIFHVCLVSGSSEEAKCHRADQH